MMDIYTVSQKKEAGRPTGKVTSVFSFVQKSVRSHGQASDTAVHATVTRSRSAPWKGKGMEYTPSTYEVYEVHLIDPNRSIASVTKENMRYPELRFASKHVFVLVKFVVYIYIFIHQTW